MLAPAVWRLCPMKRFETTPPSVPALSPFVVEIEVPKGYLYGAMGFSAAVESLNLWAKRRARAGLSAD